jgi:DNA gyrase subunit A
MKKAAVAEQIQTTDLGAEAEARYLNYALSVITSRALPDIRDGLKPVQRRLLYAMHQNLRLGGDARPRKSAAVVGEVLGKYHPHGDQAAYEAMVRLAQPFSLRYPLVQGEGNFGSLDGDGAAAMRYTEAKLAPLSEELFRDLRGATIHYRPNYDATLDEPVVLPSAIPQLLLNGASGIAVGMATSIPPHNFTEVINALLAMIDDPTLTTAGLLKHIKGPDFPTGGEILTSKRELREIYEKGQGTIKLRGEWKVESLPRGKRQVVITSLPYTVNKAQLVEKIAEFVSSRKIPQVIDVRDESTDDIRIVLELKGNTADELAMAYLCRHTSLQTSFSINLTCLVPTGNPEVGQPLRATLSDLCRHFLDFRFEVVTKRFEHELEELETRLHILAGLALIADQLDAVIRLIRSAASRKDAREKLRQSFQLTEVQADAILDIRLYQLARLEVEKIQTERREKEVRAQALRRLLRSKSQRWTVIRDELEALGRQYGDRRRTALRSGEQLNYDPDAYIVHEEATVVLSRDGWIKRVRELKDPTSTRLREGDDLKAVLPGTTRDRLAVFTNRGMLYVLRINAVPATTGYGEPIQTLFNFQDGEQVVTARLIPDRSPESPTQQNGVAAAKPGQDDLFAPSAAPQATVERGPALLLATAKGLGFRFEPNVEETTRNGRKIARLSADDAVIAVRPVNSGRTVCATAAGYLLAFPTEDITELSGVGRGVILMRLEKDDRLVGAVTSEPGAGVTVINKDGKERKIPLRDIPLGKRAGKGRRIVKRSTLVGVQQNGTRGGSKGGVEGVEA